MIKALFVWVLRLLASFFSVPNDLPLDMANKSVDDAFEGCRDQMRELVIRNYLQQELNSSTHFATVWKTAIDKVNSTKSELNKTQAAAIYVYTLGGQNTHDHWKQLAILELLPTNSSHTDPVFPP